MVFGHPPGPKATGYPVVVLLPDAKIFGISKPRICGLQSGPLVVEGIDVKAILGAIGSVFLVTTAMAAGDGPTLTEMGLHLPTPYLKGVPTIQYTRYSTGPCGVDLKAWDTAIDFVANQSAKLKLVTVHDYDIYIAKLMDDKREAFDKAISNKHSDEDRRTLINKLGHDTETAALL
jgi:hypothetical protein